MPKTSDATAYELTFILGEKATPEDGKNKSAALKQLIEKLGGKVEKEEQWGRRELAYIIKRQRSGFYVTIWFNLPSSGLTPLNQNLRFDSEIIRSLVTRAYTSAQPGTLYPVAEAEKSSRPERGSRAATDGKEPEAAASAEEMLRRSTTPAKESKPKEELAEESAIPEAERLKQLDETLEELLKEEE